MSKYREILSKHPLPERHDWQLSYVNYTQNTVIFKCAKCTVERRVDQTGVFYWDDETTSDCELLGETEPVCQPVGAS